MVEEYLTEQEFIESENIRGKLFGDEPLLYGEADKLYKRYDELLTLGNDRAKITNIVLVNKSRKGLIVLSREEAFRLGENDDSCGGVQING